MLQLVQLAFDKILQTKAYTEIVLKAAEKKFAIYVDPSVGKTLQLYLTETEKPRPHTYDLISSLCKGLDIRVKQVVINDYQETIFFARLFLEQQQSDVRHILEIDARPSDCIVLALMHNAPVFCAADVLAKIVPLVD